MLERWRGATATLVRSRPWRLGLGFGETKKWEAGEEERAEGRLRGLLILFAQQEERGHSGELTTGAMPQPLWPREEDDRAWCFSLSFPFFFVY